MKRPRALLMMGVIAPQIYVVTVVLGGVLRPNYSHVAQTVSELIEAGAEARPLLVPLFALYNGLLITFAVALQSALPARRRLFHWAAVLLGLNGILGIVVAIVPMDLVGAPVTLPGILHIVLAGILSLSSMAAVLLSALGWRGVPGGHASARLGFITLAVIFLSGAVATLSAAQGWPTMGLWERITSGAFLFWLLVTALSLLRRERGAPRG